MGESGLDKKRVLLVYYSLTNQSRLVADVLSEEFESRDWDVKHLKLEMEDSKYSIQVPLKPFWPKLLSFLVPQILGKTCHIRYNTKDLAVPYDLICICSPTWWFMPAMPIVSFLKSKFAKTLIDGREFAVIAVCRKIWWFNAQRVKTLAQKAGGRFISATGVTFPGGQFISMLTFISYMTKLKNMESCLGISIHEYGLSKDSFRKVREFSTSLINRVP